MITIQIDARNAIDMVHNISVNLPRTIDKGMEELALKSVDNLRQSALDANIQPWGKGKERSIFRGGIFKRKISETQYNIYMAKHGIYLDSMRPHWVALKRGREITRWALDRGLAIPMKFGGAMATIYPVGLRKIWVKPHPFIKDAFAKTIQDIKLVERRVRRNVNSKGRVV